MGLIDAAADAGADAVKFQTFRADKVASRVAPKAGYQVQNTRDTGSQLAMLKALEFPPETYLDLRDHANRRGILFMSTPFDFDSAALLYDLGVPVFKIPSGEITNLPLLRRIGQFGVPLIMSTGMARLGEVEEALAVLAQAGNTQVALLQCVSNYPAAPEDSNLRAMHTMAKAFGVPVGYSDHTLGLEVALAAVALGASVLEKHFTLDRDLPGPDHKASLTHAELKALVRGVRTVESALGSGIKQPSPAEEETRQVARRSLAAARDIPAGTALSEDMLCLLRPATGLPPTLIDVVLGRTVRRPVTQGELITWEDLH